MLKKLSLLTMMIFPCLLHAAPETPAFVRDVHMTERQQYTRPTIPAFQTSADGRIALSHKGESGRVAFRLQVPEKIRVPFVDSSPGTSILSAANAVAPWEATISQRDVAGNSHLGLCDPGFDHNSPIQNPQNCGGDDCYELVVIRSENIGSNKRLVGTPVYIRVDEPKTPHARIVDVQAGTPVRGSSFPLRSFFEPITVGDGRLLVARNSNGNLSWRDSRNQTRNTQIDSMYFVNDNPDAFQACDVRQWNRVYPLSHAPYDATINRRYGFAMHVFRDAVGNVIAEGNNLASYPWIDKGGDMISLATVGLNLWNPQNYSQSIFPEECIVSNCLSPANSQNWSDLNGRVVMGLWTQGKMVLLDNLINNVDFNIASSDRAQRRVQLYEPGNGHDGYLRIGNGRDNRHSNHPASSSGNTTFLDSNEHRFNYLESMRPVTPADVTWLMSSGRGTAEVAFDDFVNPDSFINANMAQAMVVRSSGYNATRANEVQNAATALPERWVIPASGRMLGEGRIEPVANGGLHGKGYWLDGHDSGLVFDITRQPRNIRNSDWYYSMFIDPRELSGEQAIFQFPDGSEVRLAGSSQLRFYQEDTRVHTVNLPNAMQLRRWFHLAFQVSERHHRVQTLMNGMLIDERNFNRPMFRMSPGEFRVANSTRPGVGVIRAWIDDVKVFAQRLPSEVACNIASGTLVGLRRNASQNWRTMANRQIPAFHQNISQQLRVNARPTSDRYLCYHDYAGDMRAHLRNIPTGMFSIRDDLIFPEGPLVHNRPRPDSSGNVFCLTCHTSEGRAGMGMDALVLRPNILARDDARRQPSQPDARVFGNIPANWLGNDLPANAFVADRNNGYQIDRLLLPVSAPATPTPRPTATPAPTIVDQCDTTQQCRNIYGNTATDCRNSWSNQSVCMCGSRRCDS